MSATATLGGVQLTAVHDFSWPLTAGTKPQQRVFETSRVSAAAILAKRGQPMTFKVEVGGHPVLEIAGLYVIASQPGGSPYTMGLLVTDRRWFWQRKTVARDFNMRRRTGDTRLVGEGILVTNQPLVADVAYAPWSLKKGKRWEADDCLKDVLDELETGNYVMPTVFSRKIEVDDLSFAVPGDIAIESVLAYVGGYDVTIDPDGRARVFDRYDRGEGAVLALAGPPIVGTGLTDTVDRSYSRPSEVNVLFERECELRFDFTEEGDPWTSIRNGDKDRVPRTLENVLPCPDITLIVGARTVSLGAWINVDDFLTALQGKQNAFSLEALTQARIRRYYVGMWITLFTRYAGAGELFDLIWAKRMHAIENNWRKTFRLIPPWRDKIRSLRAYRCAVIDAETGTRAPAEAFTDYISVPTLLPFLAGHELHNPDLGHQIQGYADLLANAKTAPAQVTVLDEEAGVIRISLRTDRFGETERMIPGNVDGLPSAVVRDTRQIANFKATLADCILNTGFKLAVVISAVQAAPNNIGRFHKHKVVPAGASVALGRDVGACKGPAWTALIGGNITAARFAWKDDFATQIDEAFFTGAEYPVALLTNGPQIQALAVAEAARIYASLLDRIEGAMTVALNPSLRVAGTIKMVEHRIATSGMATTTIAIDPDLEPLDLMGIVPASMQRAIRKMVQI